MWILIVILCLTVSDLYAANPYQLGELDYFYKQANQEIVLKEETGFDWREPSVDVEGKLIFYTPPQVVLALLENPNLQNARGYIHWQKQKVQKIIKAQEMVDQVIQEEQQR